MTHTTHANSAPDQSAIANGCNHSYFLDLNAIEEDWDDWDDDDDDD